MLEAEVDLVGSAALRVVHETHQGIRARAVVHEPHVFALVELVPGATEVDVREAVDVGTRGGVAVIDDAVTIFVVPEGLVAVLVVELVQQEPPRLVDGVVGVAVELCAR